MSHIQKPAKITEIPRATIARSQIGRNHGVSDESPGFTQARVDPTPLETHECNRYIPGHESQGDRPEEVHIVSAEMPSGDVFHGGP